LAQRKLPALGTLRAFEVLARTGTLAKAAEELCVTPSAVGHQVRALETWLGTPLFETAGRQRVLSAEGARLAADIGKAFDQLAFACRSVAQSAAQELHINVTPTFAIRWLVPRLGRFHARHPDIAVHIATSAKPIDLTREHMHAALRFGRPPWTGLSSELIFMEDVFPVCHPKLLSGRRRLNKPVDLRHHTLLHSLYRRDDWTKWFEAAGVEKSIVDPTQGLTFDLTTMAIDAAENGLGVAITREAQVSQVIESGRLVAPFRRDLMRGEGCYFLARPALWHEPHVASFRQWLLEEARRAFPAAAHT
jgi:LysR family transcriptional regulator, glycine cleavage system transcriptional activator